MVSLLRLFPPFFSGPSRVLVFATQPDLLFFLYAIPWAFRDPGHTKPFLVINFSVPLQMFFPFSPLFFLVCLFLPFPEPFPWFAVTSPSFSLLKRLSSCWLAFTTKSDDLDSVSRVLDLPSLPPYTTTFLPPFLVLPGPP